MAMCHRGQRVIQIPDINNNIVFWFRPSRQNCNGSFSHCHSFCSHAYHRDIKGSSVSIKLMLRVEYVCVRFWRTQECQSAFNQYIWHIHRPAIRIWEFDSSFCNWNFARTTGQHSEDSKLSRQIKHGKGETVQKSDLKSGNFAVNQAKVIVKVFFSAKSLNSRPKMIHERVPNPFEIYLSWLVATDRELVDGIFVPRAERKRRIVVDRTDRHIALKTYEESILRKAYIQLAGRRTLHGERLVWRPYVFYGCFDW